MKNRTLKEMNEQFKNCPMHSNEYEIDGTKFLVHSHFIGKKKLNEVLYDISFQKALDTQKNS